MRVLHAPDQAEFDEELSAEDETWLRQVQDSVRASDHLIRLGDAAKQEPEFLVSQDEKGRWRAGRYIGELALGDRRLSIRPRLGEDAIERWAAAALNLVAVPETSAQDASYDFIARLMAAVWCRLFDAASRHGPPALRREHSHEGVFVRGRLDVRETARLRHRGSAHIASSVSHRALDNDVSRAVVAAERALTQRLGNDRWKTPRVKAMLPRLREAVGGRPQLPDRRTLRRIRYTPITRPFREVADLSWRIAQFQGFGTTKEEGESEGLLLDVAELWELYVLRCVREAFPELDIEHGTTDTESRYLLRHRTNEERGLGHIKPDILVTDSGVVVAVLDAKYKRLRNAWPERRQGVDQGDLYQLAAYLSRYATGSQTVGGLVYPRDPEQDEVADAEEHGPWLTEGGTETYFRRLALGTEGAITELQEMLAAE